MQVDRALERALAERGQQLGLSGPANSGEEESSEVLEEMRREMEVSRSQYRTLAHACTVCLAILGLAWAAVGVLPRACRYEHPTSQTTHEPVALRHFLECYREGRTAIDMFMAGHEILMYIRMPCTNTAAVPTHCPCTCVNCRNGVCPTSDAVFRSEWVFELTTVAQNACYSCHSQALRASCEERDSRISDLEVQALRNTSTLKMLSSALEVSF